MSLETSTVFAPPPSSYCAPKYPLGRLVSPSIRRRRLPKPDAFTSTANIEALPLPYDPNETATAPSAHDRAQMLADISRRLQFLRIEAEIDDVPFSEASLTDFQEFMREVNPRSRPAIFLNDNGNLRSLWKNERREQVGLQFLGGGMIQLVIFKQRKGSPTMARVAGIDRKNKIFGHIKASDAEELLFA